MPRDPSLPPVRGSEEHPMSTEDRDTHADQSPRSEAEPGTKPASPTVETWTGRILASLRRWATALLAGLVAGLISWGLGEATSDLFSLEAEYASATVRLMEALSPMAK